jgi:hypothetical protein
MPACSGRGEHGCELCGRELLGGKGEREYAVPLEEGAYVDEGHADHGAGNAATTRCAGEHLSC